MVGVEPHSMTLPPRSRVSVKESVVNLLSFMRQLRLLFRMVGARSNKDSELMAPTRLGLLQSNHVRMPSPRFSSKAADRKSTRLNSSHYCASRMPSSACTKKQLQ